MRLSTLLIFSLANLLLLLINNSHVRGDLVFAVEVDPPIAAGETTSVTVSATSTDPSGQTVSGFNLPIDLNGLGNNNAGGIFTNVELQNLVGGLSSLNDAELQNSLSGSDFLVNISNGDGFLVSNSATDLFNLILTTDPSLDVGSFPVEISTGGLFQVTAQDGTDLSSSSSVFVNPDGTQGSVNIVSVVPEPNSLMLLMGTLGMTGLRRRRN